jgi:predicted CXXCH cytochrome family protein
LKASLFLICLIACNWNLANAYSKPDTVFNHTGTSISAGANVDSCAVCHKKGQPEMATQTGQICFNCHGQVALKELRNFRHVSVINDKYPALSCEGCHTLHRAKGKPVLAASEIDLCTSCHRETKEYNSHPVIEYTNKFGQRLPVIGNDGKIINCASHCHDVHGADYNNLCRLEPGRELCISCHKDFEK